MEAAVAISTLGNDKFPIRLKFCTMVIDMDSITNIVHANRYITNIWEVLRAIDIARKTCNLYCLMKDTWFECIVVLATEKAQTLYKTQFFDFCEYFRINSNNAKRYIRHPDGDFICVVVL